MGKKEKEIKQEESVKDYSHIDNKINKLKLVIKKLEARKNG